MCLPVSISITKWVSLLYERSGIRQPCCGIEPSLLLQMRSHVKRCHAPLEKDRQTAMSRKTSSPSNVHHAHGVRPNLLGLANPQRGKGLGMRYLNALNLEDPITQQKTRAAYTKLKANLNSQASTAGQGKRTTHARHPNSLLPRSSWPKKHNVLWVEKAKFFHHREGCMQSVSSTSW